MSKPKESLSFAEERDAVTMKLVPVGSYQRTCFRKGANWTLSSGLITRMAEELEYYASLDESGYPKPYSKGMCPVLDEFRSALEESKT